MSIQPGTALYGQNVGIHAQNVEIPFIPKPPRAPTANDVLYPLGKRWLNSSTGNEYVLGSQTNSSGVLQSTWTLLGAGSGGALNTLTAGDSVVVTPVGANINFIDSANVVSTGSGDDVTFDLGSSISVSGTVTAGTGITSTTGNITATAGNVAAGAAVTAVTTVTAGTGITSTTGNITATAGNVAAGAAVSAVTTVAAGTTVTAGTDLISTAGNVLIQGAAKQLRVEGGAVTDFIGQAVLVNGTVTVANTNIAATDRILVTRTAKNASIAYGTFQVVITAATNFIITSCKSDTTTETNDVSTVDYFIVRQL